MHIKCGVRVDNDGLRGVVLLPQTHLKMVRFRSFILTPPTTEGTMADCSDVPPRTATRSARAHEQNQGGEPRVQNWVESRHRPLLGALGRASFGIVLLDHY